MDRNNTDLVSMANRKAFSDWVYQRNCLVSLIEMDAIKQCAQEKLKTILRDTFPQYLPPPDSCPVVIRFDSQKVPHFEFNLRPKPLPIGWPDYDCDKDVAFYSAKIYNILKKDIDREDAAKKGVFENDVNGGGAGTPSPSTAGDEEGGRSEEENEAYQEAIDRAQNNNFHSSVHHNSGSASFNGELPIAGNSSIVNNSRRTSLYDSASTSHTHHHHRQLRPPPTLPFNEVKQEEHDEDSVTFTGDLQRTSTPNAAPSSFKRKSSSTIPDFFVSKSQKQSTSHSAAPAAPADSGNTTENNNSGIDYNSAWLSFRERFRHSTDDAEVLVYAATPLVVGDNRKYLICPLCGKRYDPHYLKEHINVVHFKKRPYQCLFENCPFVAGNESYARRHVQNYHEVPASLSSDFIEYIEYID